MAKCKCISDDTYEKLMSLEHSYEDACKVEDERLKELDVFCSQLVLIPCPEYEELYSVMASCERAHGVVNPVLLKAAWAMKQEFANFSNTRELSKKPTYSDVIKYLAYVEAFVMMRELLEKELTEQKGK